MVVGARVSPAAILAGLNPPQRAAATHPDGPVLVLAGAGSGKTRVLTHRVAYLLAERRARTEEICAVTFTNKAAAEMRERVTRLLLSFFPEGVPGESRLTVATFHSLCVRMLREDGAAIGVPRTFSIYDEDDREAVIRRLLSDGPDSGSDLRPSRVASAISAAKNRMRGPEVLASAARGPDEERIAEVYRRYEKALRAAQALDFDDLLLFAVRLLAPHEAARQKWASRFRHLLVDEYQDTNAAQYEITRSLCTVHRNVFVVGDEDQSIYRFRGADIRNILRFEEDFPDATEIRLEQNYRSTQAILSAASGLIARNASSRHKVLWTDRAQGERIVVFPAEDPQQEAAFVAGAVQRELASGRRLSDCAVLYRTNAQSRAFEQVFLRWGIRCEVVGAVRFYERREIKDVLSYVRVAANPADEAALFRALNAPPRGIGEGTQQALRLRALELSVPAREVLRNLCAGGILSPAAARKLRPAAEVFSELEAVGAGAAPEALIAEVLARSGIVEDLRRRKEEDRLENVRELVAAAAEFSRGREGATASDFLSACALATGADELSEDAPAVRMMTVHNAKGLEFPVVFLAGLEEGLFPHFSTLDRPDEIEEERRLCYVGITRCKDRLSLSWAATRGYSAQGFGQRLASRFLREIPAECLADPEAAFLRRADRDSGDGGGWPLETRDGGTAGAAHSGGAFALGDRVVHPRFGEGLVLSSFGRGDDARVTVSFTDHGRKDLVLRLARLTRL